MSCVLARLPIYRAGGSEAYGKKVVVVVHIMIFSCMWFP